MMSARAAKMMTDTIKDINHPVASGVKYCALSVFLGNVRVAGGK
jgi:hypothetical protein